MVKDREECILYTCATCNLQCRYCGIDKNPILQEIDKYLDESFKGDYYFNQINKMFPNRAKLKWLQTWGGEFTLPFIKSLSISLILKECLVLLTFLLMVGITNFLA